MIDSSQLAINQTIEWIKSVVIELNFCPFASKVFNNKSIRYVVLSNTDTQSALECLLNEFGNLDTKLEIETTLIIFSNDYKEYNYYLDLLDKSNDLLLDNNYEGIYQLASFHPLYCFAGSDNNDAANYTNRSPYPMLHLLRENSITKALQHFPNPENIPLKNIAYTRDKGLKYMALLRAACMK